MISLHRSLAAMAHASAAVEPTPDKETEVNRHMREHSEKGRLVEVFQILEVHLHLHKVTR